MLAHNFSSGRQLPQVLLDALPNLRTAGKKETPRKRIPAIRKATRENSPGKLRFASAIKEKNLSARGAGIYEDNSSGEIWYREGEFLVRKALNLDELVQNYADSCRGK